MAQATRIIGNTKGLNPSFLSKVNAAADAVGATSVRITSGYRDPATNARVGGVPRSNHLTGDAIDGYATIKGKEVPLAIALDPVVSQFGLRSGNQPGFYRGGRDTVHVDDARNQGPSASTPSQTGVPPELQNAVNRASVKYGTDPSVLLGIWAMESGRTFPNPAVNSSGYGGLFGTHNWNASTQDQANTAAEILSRLVRVHHGDMRAALLAYSGNGYSSVPSVSGGVQYTSGGSSGGGSAGSAATGGSVQVSPFVPSTRFKRGQTFQIFDPSAQLMVAIPATTDIRQTKPQKTATKPTTRIAAPFDINSLLKQFSPTTTKALTALANKSAQSEIAAQVAAFRAQQAYELGLGQQQNRDILAAGTATRNYLAGLAQEPKDSYQQAIENTQALASGFSPQLAGDIQAQTDRANADLAAANAPSRLESAAQPISDVLLGLSGKIPTDVLGSQQRAAIAQAQAYPGQAFRAAEEAGLGALGAARDRAAQYTGQILAENAKLPTLRQQYLSSYSDLQNKQYQNLLSLLQLNKPTVTGSQQGGYVAINPLTGQVTPLTQGTGQVISNTRGIFTRNPDGTITQNYAFPQQLKPITGSYGYVAVLNPNTGKLKVIDPGYGPPGAQPKTTIQTAADGSKSAVTVDPTTGNITTTPLPGTLGKGKVIPKHYQLKNVGGITTAFDPSNPADSYPLIGKDGNPIPWAQTQSGNIQKGSIVIKGKTYQTQYNPATGGWDLSTGPGGKPIVTKVPTAGKVTISSALIKAAADRAKGFYEGVPAKRRWIPPQFDNLGKLRKGTGRYIVDQNAPGADSLQYYDAITQLLLMGPPNEAWKQIVLRDVNSLYAPGEGGRPYPPKTQAEINAATTGINKAIEAAGTKFSGLITGF